MDRTMFDSQIEALADDYRVVAYESRARTDQFADSYNISPASSGATFLLLDRIHLWILVVGPSSRRPGDRGESRK